MAEGFDQRSKYRNPDMPVGYVKPEIDLIYAEGREIDGVHYVWAPYIYDAHIEEREDYETLSDLITSGSDEEIDSKSKASPSTSGAGGSTKYLKTRSAVREQRDSISKASASTSGALGNAKYLKTTSAVREQRGYDSGDSSPEITHRQKKKIEKKYSSDLKVKQEPMKQPQTSAGNFYCDICNIHLNSALVYNSHVNGKKHLKNIKKGLLSTQCAATVTTADDSTTAIPEGQSKYSIPAPNVFRRKVQKVASAQHIIEKTS